jgi:hypothetical protein
MKSAANDNNLLHLRARKKWLRSKLKPPYRLVSGAFPFPPSENGHELDDITQAQMVGLADISISSSKKREVTQSVVLWASLIDSKK